MSLSNRELKRQLWHLIAGIFLIILIYFNILTTKILIGLVLFGCVILSICKSCRVPIISWLIDQIGRKKETKTLPGLGVLMFLLGCLIAIILFPKNIALASIAILTVGDSTAHIFGKMLKEKKYRGIKSVKGTTIGATLAVIAAMCFVKFIPALMGGVIAMTYENLKGSLNDNLTIPIIAGVVIALL